VIRLWDTLFPTPMTLHPCARPELKEKMFEVLQELPQESQGVASQPSVY
jgi:hypothetical protein